MSNPSADSLKGRIYLALLSRLTSQLSYTTEEDPRPIPSLAWVDKNHGQFNRPEMHLPVPMPAILISFPDTEWEHVGRGWQKGRMRIRVEVGYENYADSFDGSPNIEEAIRFFEFNEATHQALQGWSCPGITTLERVADAEDDDHGNVIRTILEYETSVEDRSASKDRGTQEAEGSIIPKFITQTV